MSAAGLSLSGIRFRAVYRVAAATEAEARAAADDLCVEQTVEFPPDLIERADIREEIFGRVEARRELDAGAFEIDVSFAWETAGAELTQLLNVLFGNSSLKPGLRLQRIELPDEVLATFPGPRFGRDGLRALVGAPERALLCSAIKPMGLSPAELAELAAAMARGGVDLVKDDHGLANQSFCPFEERVARCAEAVDRANREGGSRCLYAPNITAPADKLFERARFAREAGAGALLVAPGLVGHDSVRALAADGSIGLPLIAHPALQGSFVLNPREGVSHEALFGQLARLAGADASIFPHLGGRFRFSEEDCRGVVRGCTAPMGPLRAILPSPAGGMSLARVPEMLDFYGRNMLLLVGGDLHRHGADLAASCRRFRALLDQAVS